MRKVLILMGRYLPGHKDGGPLRTIINVTDALGDEYDFRIVCLDRDHGDAEAYSGIKRDDWNQAGKAKVWYVAPGGFSDELILKLVHGMDCVYLTSFYDDYGYKTLLLKRRGKIKQPVYLASMGVFSAGALAQKPLKKRVFIAGCKMLGLFKNITWSVTSELEAEDVKRVIGNNVKYIVAEDLPRSNVPGRTEPQHTPMRVAFLSRICEHKGLDIAIDAIKESGVECQFTVYGPVQEKDYWEKCRAKLEGMNWTYYGDVPSDEVQEKLSHEDVLILPTKSENYGHVIFEALSVGCIPLISNQTPWTLGDAGVVASRNVKEFSQCILFLSRTDRTIMSNKAIQLANYKIEETYRNTGYRQIFQYYD